VAAIPKTESIAAAPSATPQASLWSQARRNFVLGTLCLVVAVNMIDRQLITILLEPIKREFKASDTLMGLLTGLSFAAVYVIAAFPIARWSDRGVRRTVISVCVAAWSFMTMVTGLAQSYAQLAATRMGVALGEAGCNPPSHSMIADLFPLGRRATAIGIFNGAASVGLGFGLFFGGWLNSHFQWRTVFFIIGLPGLVLALLIHVFVPEPPRGLSDGITKSRDPLPLRKTVAWLASLRTFRFLALSALSCSFVNFGLIAWIATFFMRVHGTSPTEVGLKLGLATAIGLLIGTIASGLLADWLGRRDIRWYMRIAGGGVLLSIPFALLALLSPNQNVAFALYCPAIGLLASWATPVHTMTQTIAAPRMRGLASAIVSFFHNLIGYGLGPLAVGMLNDALGHSYGAGAVRYSLMILMVLGVASASVCFATNASVRDDYRRARESQA
jgi:predicted MFS family arabinose efflux permease